MYKIIVSKAGEPYMDEYKHERRDWTSVYEQSIEDLDVPGLATFLNSQPVKRSHKKKEEKVTHEAG